MPLASVSGGAPNRTEKLLSVTVIASWAVDTSVESAFRKCREVDQGSRALLGGEATLCGTQSFLLPTLT